MTPSAENLQQWLPRLARLDGCLRQYDLPRGPDRWQKAEDLLFALDLQGRFPDPLQMRLLLGPLFCRSAEEQERFVEAFDQWLRQDPELKDEARGGMAAESKRAPTTAEVPESPKGRRKILLALLLGLLLGLLLVYGIGYWVAYDPKEPTIEPPRPVAGGAETKRIPAPELQLQPVPPRPQPEPLEQVFPQSPRHQALLNAVPWVLAALPLLIGLGWLGWRWTRWQAVLRNRSGNADDPVAHITFDPPEEGLFNSRPLRAALRRLHTPVPVATRRVDAPATVDATARHAGLLQPRFLDRHTAPECVLLSDSRHSADHLGALANLLARRLREADLEVHHYRYDRSPGRVRAARGGRSERLTDMAARHAGARLLLVGEPALLVDPYREEIRPWVEAQEDWADRVLLSTRQAPAAWLPVLETAGIRVSDFDSDGLVRLAERLSGARGIGGATAPPQRLPELLQGTDRWTAALPPPRAEREGLLPALARFLGRDGLQLLAAMAAYPALHWELTRALDRSLFEADAESRREARLLAIARLPWSREGWLPDWLREALLASRSDEQRRSIDAFYRNLMGPRAEIDGQGPVALPIATDPNPKPGLLPWLRDWWQTRANRSLIKDRIFAEVLLGRGIRPLDFPLARHLLEKLAVGPRLLLPRLAGVLILGGLIGWGLVAGWNGWARAPLEAWSGQVIRPDFSGQTVLIRHTPATEPLARALRDSLQGFGFPLPELETRPSPADQPGANRVISAAEASPEATSFVARRLLHLSWGEPVLEEQLLGAEPPGNRLVVELNRPGRTGSEFRDALAVELTPQRLAQLGQPWQERPEDRQDTPANFRDGLRDGGQGPEMAVIPAGGFQMGSPEEEPERYGDEGPQHQVSLGAFALSKTEVTFDDYDRFATATGRDLPNDQGWGRGQRPVINVSWEDAVAYAEWLSQQTGQGYRLPSEAEWEYAARAGTETPFSTGDCITTDQANYNGNADYNDCGAQGVYREKTVPAGSLPANPWGLHEVHGNVWEWTQDCWHEGYADAPADGRPWLESAQGDCSRRVVRGGSWDAGPWSLRSAYRGRGTGGGASSLLGFRVARTL